MKISAILLAAGSGKRLKKGVPKAFVQIGGKEIFLNSIELFEKSKEVSEIILVVPKNKVRAAKSLTQQLTGGLTVRTVSGGATRQKSLEKGLRFCSEKTVLVHNAANPFATPHEITRLAKTLKKYDAAAVAHRATSTVRQNLTTLDRQKIWLMETPQLVKKEFLAKGLRVARSQKIETTDEIQLAQLAGAKIKIIAADPQNRKITRPADLPRESRIGLGHDSHRFSEVRKALFLGGVKISATGGLEGNSDGDVILHALTNAISSALGGGSLSTFSDAMCARGEKNSQKYLQVVLAKMCVEDFVIENLAISIEGKKPKLEKHFPKIRKKLAGLLKTDSAKIGLVATTGEELTSYGRGEGLQVFAVVLLRR